MNWKLVTQSRSSARLELYQSSIRTRLAWVTIEGSHGSFRWNSSCAICGVQLVLSGNVSAGSMAAAAPLVLVDWQKKFNELINTYATAELRA